jgi:HYR domain
MGAIAGVSAIIGTILAILTFYYGTYLPYVNGQVTPATEAFSPILQAIPGAEAQHDRNNPDPDTTNTDTTNTDTTNTDTTNTDTNDTNTDPNPPICTVPDDITEEATGPDGAQVSFEVSCEDDVDRVVNVNCNPESGETFPIGETVVTCSAEDSAGNRAEESFTITVEEEEEEPPIPDDEEPPIREAELIEEPPVNDTEG